MTGYLALVEREVYRFIRLINQTVAPPLITTVMYILIFGYSLGAHIKEIHGTAYILYIIPGLLQMSVITNAYANTSTSLFMARLERSIENLLVAPLRPFQIVSSFLLGGLLRGLVVAGAIIGGALLFLDLPFEHPGIIILSILLTSFLFSGLGIISALFAETWEKISIFTNFVITPFVYLGGVFYSVTMLPEPWKTISMINPIFHCVDLVRYGFLGVSDAPVMQSLIIVTAMGLVIYALCIWLFWTGYKLVK